mmetsp:Transcript_5048/g.20719  ORF Transcript_5048/g.20719 Transcript_5048/m.20719 type:complete len:268 (-) Transcript_5048:1302-2105(-)
MEDVFGALNLSATFAAGAVFDGAGGARAAHVAKRVVGSRLGSSTSEANLRDVLKRAEQTALATATKNGRWHDASTAVVGVADEDVVRVAWIGDSPAVLVKKDGSHEMLTKAHSASDNDEAERVKRAGGRIGRSQTEAKAGAGRKLLGKLAGPGTAFSTHKNNPKRIYPGGIVLTRALGGLPLKYATPKLVIADPDVASRARAGDELCLLLASDGLFERLDVDAVVKLLAETLCGGGGPENAAGVLVKAAEDAGASDNICAVVLCFNE